MESFASNEDDENMETTPLTPGYKILYDDTGAVVRIRPPLASLASPRLEHPRKRTPFKESVVDRRTRTPMYKIERETPKDKEKLVKEASSPSTPLHSIPLSPFRQSPSALRDTISSSAPRQSVATPCRLSNASTATHLYGEGLVEDVSVVSSDVSSIKSSRHEMIDIEAGEYIVESEEEELTVGQLQAKKMQVKLHQWKNHARKGLVRVGTFTSQELSHVARLASERITRSQQDSLSSPRSHTYDDLTSLQRLHKEKVSQMSNVDHEEYHDFALVLTPQAVYAFWADLLDFRAEQLGEEATAATSPQTQGTEHSDGSAEVRDTTTIDSRPFLTPYTGMRRRRGRFSQDDTMSSPKETPAGAYTAPRKESTCFPSTGMFTLDDSGRRVAKPRTSLFERAVGVLSPSMRLSFTASKRNLYRADETPTSTRETPNVSSTTRRRRWGNHAFGSMGASTPDITSPPVRSIMTMGSSMRKRRITRSSISSRVSSVQVEDECASPNKRRKPNPNSISIEEIPTQIIPRGIAARTNGMMQFLAALKKGFVVRRHRPGAEAVFCRIISTNGGDTIKYKLVDEEEAMLAFQEQRQRYNRKFRRSDPTVVRSISRRWSNRNATDEAEQIQTMSLPDFVAAKQYRNRFIKGQAGISKRVTDMATKVANSGAIRAAELVAVHPARHLDPRSAKGELGTASLRRSKSEYYSPHTFSLVTRVGQALTNGKPAALSASEKRWKAGEGSDVQFKTVDFEAATEGEYWLIFRGFLRLQRDAVFGRFAQQRAAGFGSNYNRRELEDREQKEVEAESLGNILHKDEFGEPPTISRLERFVVEMRKLDTSYMEGHVAPGAKPPPSDYFLGFRSSGTQIWSRLRQAGLETQRVYGLDTKNVMIKVRCPSDRLTDVAEVLRLKLKTREGTYIPFKENMFAIFQPLDDDLDSPGTLGYGASLFRSSERQAIIDFIIRSRIRDSGAELGKTTDLGKMIQSRVPLHMHAKLDSLYDSWFYYWRWNNWIGRDGQNTTIGTQPVPRSSLSSSSEQVEEDAPLTSRRVPNIFVRLTVGCFYQPLDAIEQYFGEKVAFYFAWLQHCSFHLTFLAFAGLIVFICQIASGNWDHWIRPFYALFVMLWSFVVMVNWRKRSNYLAHTWGTMDYKEQETTRPQFKGEYRKDEITQEWVVHYPSWKRYLKYLISLPLTVAFTVASLIFILIVHANRDLLLARYFESKSNSESFQIEFSMHAIGQQTAIDAVNITQDHLRDPVFWFITAGLPSAVGLFLPLLNFILMRVSMMLNDFENYRTESEYRTHLIIKVFSFRFVCYFATLYYYAFISTGSPQEIESGILRVGTGVFVSVTVSHWWGLFLQINFPLLMRRVRLHGQRNQLHEDLKQVELEEAELTATKEFNESEELKMKQTRLVNKRLLLDQAQDSVWEEITLPEHDSFAEYVQAVVQFAFITCFSVVLPLTPLICLFNHLLSMRLDSYKLCHGRRRPLAQKTGGIGVWEHVLHVVTVIAVLTNCWLMGFLSCQFGWIVDQIGKLGLFCVVVGWEHVMLLIKYVMQTSISTLPKAVQDEIKKEQYKLARKRNSSLRAKNGRRSQYNSPRPSYRDDSDDTSRSTGILAPNQTSVRAASDDTVGLHTIVSGEESESSPPNEKCSLEERGNTASLGMHSIPEFVPSLSRNSSECSDGNPSTNHEEYKCHSRSMIAPTPCRLHLDCEESTTKAKVVLDDDRLETPFGVFVASERFDGSARKLLRKRDSGNMSEFLGKGIDDDGSLATYDNEFSVASSINAKKGKEVEDANTAAAERIKSRLQSLEAKLRARSQNKS